MFTFRRWFSSQAHLHPLKFIQSSKKPLKDAHKSKDLNNIKLVGTLSSDVFSSPPSEKRIFYLKTFNSDNFYDSHKIIVTPYMVESLPGMPKKGQNLFVSGKLRTQNFTQENGKRGTSIQIVAKQIYLCDNTCMGSNKPNTSIEFRSANICDAANTVVENYLVKNPNKVELLAHICFDISNEETHSLFILAPHHYSKNSDGIDVDRTNFIPVFIYNETLRNIVRNQLKRLDRVRVEGILRHKACLDANGKKQYKGYIETTKIAKVISFKQIVEQTSANSQNSVVINEKK